MIDIKVIGSGSSGNCYLANINGTKILLEAGLPFKVIQKALKFKTSDISACLVTHEHMDHSKSVKDLMNAGIDVFMSEGTCIALSEKIDIHSHRIKILEKRPNGNYIDYWKENIHLFPFGAVHDVNEPVNFLIQDRMTKERLMFVTDTAYLKYKIPAVDVLMVECNYVKSILDKKVEEGKVHVSLRNRIVKNHMSLETLLEALKVADLSRLKKVYVLHLSDSNSDERLILESIQKVTGVEVEVC